MLDKNIALFDKDVSRVQKSTKYRIFPQEVVRNRTPVPPRLRPFQCQACHEWPLRSLLWLFRLMQKTVQTVPKVELHVDSWVLICPPGGQMTWGPTVPGCQRHSGVARDARSTVEKEDFETEALPYLLLNNEWDRRLSGCNLLSQMLKPFGGYY